VGKAVDKANRVSRPPQHENATYGGWLGLSTFAQTGLTTDCEFNMWLAQVTTIGTGIETNLDFKRTSWDKRIPTWDKQGGDGQRESDGYIWRG
jgi:hypothetical protein